jgi:hypothetical protein
VLDAIVTDGTHLMRARVLEGRVRRLQAELAEVCLAALERPPR